MVSGRGLGHTGGTLDKLEAIPGFRVDLDLTRYKQVLDLCGLVLIGQTAEIAPADKRLYALRDASATVESIPLISASIMSKKLAEGIDGLVLDVKTGDGAFLPLLDDSRALARAMCAIGRGLGKRMVALITRMDQPLGREVGNANEVAECVACLQGPGTGRSRRPLRRAGGRDDSDGREGPDDRGRAGRSPAARSSTARPSNDSVAWSRSKGATRAPSTTRACLPKARASRGRHVAASEGYVQAALHARPDRDGLDAHSGPVGPESIRSSTRPSASTCGRRPVIGWRRASPWP